jgi:hypothetical protein
VTRAALAAVALAGCAGAREPSETPDGAALDVAAFVRQNAADTAGALAGGADRGRLEQVWGEAIEAADEAHRTVPSSTAAKPPLLLAAAASTDAAQALALARPAQARAQLARAHALLARVADALGGRIPGRADVVARLREPLS